MKYLNMLALVGAVLFVMTSCGKENLTVASDNVPLVEPQEEIINQNAVPPSYSRVAKNGETALARFVLDTTTMEVNNYSLVIPSSLIGAPDVVFASVWIPASTETEVQETSYTVEHVETISQDGIDAWDDWVANGSDPNTMPDLFSPDSPYKTDYTNTLTYQISNITATTADVTVSGDIVDPNGNSTTVSGTLTADRYY